jgi:hypothetical protein
MASVIGFPDRVNEKAARTVAAGVGVTSIVAVATGWLWLTLPLAYGFLARVLTGPTLSPLGQLAVRVVAPRLGPPSYVAGPPKRFAQGIGAIAAVAAAAAWAVGATLLSQVLLLMLAVFAALESLLGVCVGCIVFARLMRMGWIPQSVCQSCAQFVPRASTVVDGERPAAPAGAS